MKEIATLEFDKILNKLAQHAVSPSAKELCQNLKAHETIEKAQRALEETDAAGVLLLKYGAPYFGNLKDITNACKRAENGATLAIIELLEVADVLRLANNLDNFAKDKNAGTCLDRYFEQIMPNKYLEDKINVSFPNPEEVSDNASAELKNIRRKQSVAKNRIKSALDSILHSHSKHLQENLITIRNGRYVIPVKSEYRAEINGLVHDTSSSGSTLFIEPMQVVQANNELSILASEEHAEIERILSAISAEVGTFSENIITNFNIGRFIDFCFAKARYSDELRANKPILNMNDKIELKQARHPLIPKDKVVPIDVTLGEKYNALIITGPNTGGKTISLKTIGLMCLMAKSGLFIPAKDESSVAFFTYIYADIGDEQSIEQSLSTFSSHMTNIVNIISNLKKNSLVLLDELGSGTDPTEGAALAISIIEHILQKDARLVCTTHYSELKIYAIQTEGVENASCEFNVATLQPTYRLLTGIPGKSNAFAIAQRLGLDENIINNAKIQLNNETVNMDRLFADLEINKKELEYETLKTTQLRAEAEEYNKRAESEKNKIKEEADAIIKKARKDAQNMIDTVKRSSDRILDELNEIRKNKDKEDFQKQLNLAKSGTSSSISELEKDFTTKEKTDHKPLSRPLKEGDLVKIHSLGKNATVLELPDNKGKVLLQAGIIKTKISIDDLELIENVKQKSDSRSFASVKLEKGTRILKTELDIRGKTVLDVIDLTEDFLNNCALSHLNVVSIIHGKGTGALRTAVHELLKKHSLVKEFRLGIYGEGETGVTIVTLKD